MPAEESDFPNQSDRLALVGGGIAESAPAPVISHNLTAMTVLHSVGNSDRLRHKRSHRDVAAGSA